MTTAIFLQISYWFDEGLITEMRIWSILLIKSDLNDGRILADVSMFVFQIEKTA